MAISLRAASSGSSGATAGTTISLTLPTGWQAGDLFLLIGVITGSSAATFSQTAGTGTWSLFDTGDGNTTSGSTLTTFAAWRLAIAADTAPTFTTASGKNSWACIALTPDPGFVLAIDTFAAGDPFKSSAVGNTFTPNAATAATPGEGSVLLSAGRRSATGAQTSMTYAAPTNWTSPASNIGEWLGGSSDKADFAAVAYRLGVDSGSVAPGTESITDSGSGTYTVNIYHVLVTEHLAASGVPVQWMSPPPMAMAFGPYAPFDVVPTPVPPPGPVYLGDVDSLAGSEAFTTAPSDVDAGSGSESSQLALSDADTGAGAEAVTGLAVVMPADLVPPVQPPWAAPLMGAFGPSEPFAAAPELPATPSAASLLLSDTDAGIAADSGTITLSSSDTGTGTESDPSTIRLSTSDSATGADTGQIALSASDSGTGTESDPATLKPSDTDAGTGSESSLRLALSDTDAGTGAEVSSITASLSSADTGTGAESGTVAVSDTDAGSGSDAGSGLSVVAPAEPAPPAAYLSPLAARFGPAQPFLPVHAPPVPGGIQISDTDVFAGTDAGEAIQASLTAGDSGTGAEGTTLSAALSSSDAGTGAESDPVAIRLSNADAGSSSDTSSLVVSVGSADAGAATEASPSVTLLATDGGTGAEATALLASPGSADAGAGAEQSATGPRDSDAGLGTEGASVSFNILVRDGDSARANDTIYWVNSGAQPGGADLLVSAEAVLLSLGDSDMANAVDKENPSQGTQEVVGIRDATPPGWNGVPGS